MVAITCALQRNTLQYPSDICAEDYPMPVAIHGKNGAFVMAPQNIDGSEVLAGTQRAWPEQDRAGWDALLADREGLLELFRQGYETWPEIVQSALDNVPLDTLAIWPYYVMPKLESWFSANKRVIILGDAAHAIPPTAGQVCSIICPFPLQIYTDAYPGSFARLRRCPNSRRIASAYQQ
jgi:hypothetical protein